MPKTEEQRLAYNAYMLKHYHENKDRFREKRREYAKKNSAKIVARVKKWQQENREKVNERGRRYWRKYVNPEVRSAWTEKNRERINALARERYHKNEKYKVMNLVKAASRRRSLCKWANKEKILEFYETARRLTKETGIKHVVDHIVPLKNSLVSGLTNEFNLRVISEHENAVKKNKFDQNSYA